MVSSPSAKIPHHIQPRAGVVVRLLVCLAILIGSGPLPAATVARAQSAPVTGAAADSPSAGMIVQSAAGASALDVSPAAADAIVSDPRNPAWQTRYGSLLGKLSLAPRYATFEAVMAGPDVPVGAWQAHDLQVAAKSITAIVAAPDGRLFAGVNNNGLRVYAPAANGVYSWSEIKSAANQLASNNVTALAIFRNQLWVGTSDAGISVLDLAANTWTTFNTGNGLPSNAINRLTPVKATEALSSDYLWASTNGGAALYSKPLLGNYGWSVVNTGNGLPDNEVLDVAVWTVQGTTYTFFATADGLMRRNGATMIEINGGTGCLFDRAMRIVVDHKNALWMAVQQNVPAVAAASADALDAPTGADAVDAPQAGAWVPLGVCQFTPGVGGGYVRFDASTPGLPSSLATDLSVDDAGRVWMSFMSSGGGSQGGLASYDQGAWLIMRAADAPIGDGQLNRLLAVGEAVWFGEFNSAKLHVYSPNWNYYNATAVQNPTPGDPGAILVEATRTWVGSGAGLAKFENNAWSYRPIPNNTTAVTSIVRGVDNLLYLATQGRGLYSYDGNVTFDQQTTGNGLPSDDLRDLLVDQDGKLWVATSAGLALRGTNYWLSFTAENSGLASNDLTSLTLDGSGRIWIATAQNGISIFDPNAGGAEAWSAQSVADGLPALQVQALTTEPSGAVWAGTAAGLARWNPADGQWTTYTTANGLPGNEVVSLAIDPSGLVWVGTTQGLATLEANQWLPYHVTGSFLGADRIRHLAADDKQLWSSAGSLIAVRGLLDGPIGDFPPEITSIAPLAVAPLDQIVITGNHFDDRGPKYNEVRFCCIDGQSGIAAPVGKIISVTLTTMTVEVPLLAKSGKLFVTSHKLNVESSQEIEIVPVITSISASCAGPGTLLEIHGRGFFGVGSAGAYVTIGNGPERLADAQDPTLIRQYIRANDTTGSVKVRLLNGKSATSPSGLTVAQPFVTATAIQQGVQGEQMIWGKRTLVQLFLRTTYPDYCQVKLDKGVLEWKKKDGSTQIGSYAIFPAPGGLIVPNAPPAVKIDTGINFVAEFNALRQAYTQGIFPLSQFNGMKITLRNGLIDVLTVDLAPNQFNFYDIGDRRHVLNVPVVPQNWTADQEAAFWANARKGLEDVARVYPQPDTEGMPYGNRQWLWNYHWSPVRVDYYWLGDSDDNDDGEPDDNFGDIQDSVDDIREDLNDKRCDGGNANDDDCHPWMDQAMGIVDASLYTGGYGGKATVTCYNPFGDCDRNSAVSTNFDKKLSPVWLQEAIHALEWVDTDSGNHDGDNEHHSRYDEGEWGKDINNCNASLTFRQALLDQVGGVRRVIRLDEKDPKEFSMPAMGTSACDGGLMPKSAMSYAPGQSDNNIFLEPLDYRHTLDWIKNNGLQTANAALANVEQTLRLNGRIDQTNKVTVTMSSILGTEGAELSAPTGGQYHVLMLDAGGQTLHDHSFDLAMEHTHGDANESVTSRFNLRLPFPAGVKTVAIQHDGQVLWAKQVSANAPTAAITAPNGGSFNAANVVPVTWQAADADNDSLQFALDYTPDNGQSWFLITNKLTGNSYNWTPDFVPASSQGRLRLRVSDGFNTAEVQSAPFELTAKNPLAFIYAPAEALTVTEGSLVTFEGGSLTAAGFDQGAFAWRENATVLANTRGMTQTLETVGLHVFELTVTADGLSASKSVSVTVVADYDRDGLPNSWEQAYGFNPIDPYDSNNDPDSDGLSNLLEYHQGTNPLVADTDGDSMKDGDELNVSRNPLVADSSPSGPVLQVGADQIGFLASTGGFAPEAKHFWVSNVGTGELNWNATSDAAWLQLSTTQGSAPTEVTVTADVTGMEAGEYSAQITFSAAGATNSPQVVTAKLRIVGQAGGPMIKLFLPVVSK